MANFLEEKIQKACYNVLKNEINTVEVSISECHNATSGFALLLHYFVVL